jgi:hypothetical protein
MPVYLVEEMHGDRVTWAQTIEASTPRAAASISAGRRVTTRRWARDWVRVTDELSGSIFAYCFAESDLSRQQNATPVNIES